MKKFNVIAEVMDYGECVTALIIDYEKEVSLKDVSLTTFQVTAKNIDQDGAIYYEGERKIIDVYVTQDQSRYQTKMASGRYIVILLSYGYMDKASASIYYHMVMNQGVWDFFKSYNLELALHYSVTQLKPIQGTLDIYRQDQIVRPLADQFIRKESKSHLPYRLYVPEPFQGKQPLIVWLHGSGEGGSNNASQILANKGGVGFADSKAQAIFGGAYIVAPQCPDNWAIDPDVLESINVPLTSDIQASRDYTGDVIAMIREILAAYPNIDEHRIYLIGCSAGGAMTWKTLLAAPELFAAAVPICGSLVEKEKLESVKSVPIWLIHSKDDTTVSCTNSEENYRNLQALNAEVHLTEYANVSRDGQSYPGHWSWIYALNNDPKLSDQTSLFEWLSQQRRK